MGRYRPVLPPTGASDPAPGGGRSGPGPGMGKMSSMVAWVLRLGMLWGNCLVEVGQVQTGGAPRAPSVVVGDHRSQVADVIADHLAVHVRADEKSYSTGTLQRGDRIRVRRRVEGGWAEIDPPASTIGWMERTSLDLGDGAGERGSHRLEPVQPGPGPPTRAGRGAARGGAIGPPRRPDSGAAVDGAIAGEDGSSRSTDRP